VRETTHEIPSKRSKRRPRMPRAKILVVDGDPDLVRALWLRLRFRANNYEVGTASDAIVSLQKSVQP
jgi:hypothetical protein